MYLDDFKGIFNGRTVFYEIQVSILYARLKVDVSCTSNLRNGRNNNHHELALKPRCGYM